MRLVLPASRPGLSGRFPGHDRFLRVVLGPDEAAESAPSRRMLVQYATALLWDPWITCRWMSTRRPPLDSVGTALCVTWGVARLGCDPSALFFFVVAGPAPIPHNAEACEVKAVPS
jgi:hypothetical protein